MLYQVTFPCWSSQQTNISPDPFSWEMSRLKNRYKSYNVFWIKHRVYISGIFKITKQFLTCRTLLVNPVFWASCFRSFASGLWFMAKYDFMVRSWWCLKEVRIRFVFWDGGYDWSLSKSVSFSLHPVKGNICKLCF